MPTIYAPFSHRPGWSELLSLFGLLAPLRKLSKYPRRTVIFYNRMAAYLPTLYEASRLGYRCFLDLEDGEIKLGHSLKYLIARLVAAAFDRYCHNGALLACSALTKKTCIRPVFCYYGTTSPNINGMQWQSPGIKCLMSGTLSSATGAPLLIEAIRRLRDRRPEWTGKLCFEITGKGESLEAFERLSNEAGWPAVRVHGRTTDARYLEILSDCNVGLALKPVEGELAETTFPSKVIEFAGSGLLVLSTDISDVRHLLGDSARYLERNDPELLIDLLAAIVNDPNTAARSAQLGRERVARLCSPEQAGQLLRDFFSQGSS